MCRLCFVFVFSIIMQRAICQRHPDIFRYRLTVLNEIRARR
jgi:hypothetical protein